MSIELSAQARASAFLIRLSEEDQEWVATTSAYPSLSWLDSARGAALAGLERLIADVEGAGDDLLQDVGDRLANSREFLELLVRPEAPAGPA